MEKFRWPREVFNKDCFGDLNIPLSSKAREICESAIALGFKVLAINTPVVATSCLRQVGGGGGKKQKGKKRKLEERTGGTLAATAAAQTSQGCVPKATNPTWIIELMEKHKDVRILQRLTVIFYEIGHLQAVENAATYDILACVPTNHDAMFSAIISTNVIFDIISFDIEGPHWINKVKLNRQKGKLAADKDVFFEVTYSPSFHGDGPLENMVYIGNRLTEDICTRRIKNIILSSGAASPEELRSPKDVIGIGYLLDLDETTARSTLKGNVERIVQKSDSRKFGKSWVAFVPKDDDERLDDGT